MKNFFHDYKQKKETKKKIKKLVHIIQKGANNHVKGYDYTLLDTTSCSCGVNLVLEEKHVSINIVDSFETLFQIYTLYQNRCIQLASFNSSHDSCIQWNNNYPQPVEEMKELLYYLNNITEKKIQQIKEKKAITAL